MAGERNDKTTRRYIEGRAVPRFCGSREKDAKEGEELLMR